ncbi:MAG: HEAT repeat domain-containing protein [Clostridiales bacterium]|nr:HEAT repeat domain-containing protein [Clostridiales bacterium]
MPKSTHHALRIVIYLCAVVLIALNPLSAVATSLAAPNTTDASFSEATVSGVADECEEDALIGVLQNEASSTDDKSKALQTLAGIADDRAIEAMLGYALGMDDLEASVSCFIKISKAITQQGREAMTERLISQLSQKTDQRFIIQALGCIKGSKAFNALLPFLQDTDWEIQYATVCALRMLGNNQAAAPLTALLDNEASMQHFEFKRDLIQALGEVGDAGSVDALIKMLKSVKKSGDTSCVAFIAAALGSLGSDSAIKPMIEMLPYAGNDGRNAISRACATIGGNATVDTLIAAFKKTDSLWVSNIISPLVDINSDYVVQALSKALKSNNTNMRKWAAKTLYLYTSNYRSKAAAEVLLERLKKKDVLVVAAAFLFFIDQGVEGSESVLCKALNKYGDVSMAVIFLNSHNDALEIEATRWAYKNGFVVKETERYGSAGGWGGSPIQ